MEAKHGRKGTSPHNDGTISEHGFVSFFKDKDDVGIVWLDGRECHWEDIITSQRNRDTLGV